MLKREAPRIKTEYVYRRQLEPRELLPALGVGVSVGAVAFYVTYLFLQLEKLKSTNLSYSVLNALGASLIVASLIVDFNLSALLMEVFWVLISFIGIGRHLRLKTIRS